MVAVSIQFKPGSITRVNKYLNSVPKAVNAATRKAVSAEARYTIAKSQEYVPVRTGLLKRSSFIGRAKMSGTNVVIDFGYRVKPGQYPAAYGGQRKVKIDYAPIVEYGDSQYGVKFAGRFYMRRAMNSTRIGRRERISKFVRSELRKL